MIKYIRCKEDLSLEELEEKLKPQGIKVLKRMKLTGLYKVDVPETVTTEALLKPPAPGITVLEVYDDFPVKALLDKAIPKVRANLVWEQGEKGEGMTIGICDTGLDVNHPDVKGRVSATKDFSGEGDYDGNGHGTHVATIAMGNGHASDGKYTGAAPEARVVMAKGLKSDGTGMASDIADGIEWLVDEGVDAVSLSLGGKAQPGVRDILQQTVDAVVDSGIPVFCAAGNEGPAYKTISTPGVSPKVITVGASDDSDHVADFSSRGPTYEGLKKPDIVAPGVNIIAGRAKGTALGHVINEYYTELSGTSMATPLAAGCGLLIKQKYPDITPAELKARLKEYAVNLHTNDENIEGKGRLDVYAAITQTQPPPSPVEPTPEEPGCFLSRLFAKSPAVIMAFRAFRDSVLAGNAPGRFAIDSYYRLNGMLLNGQKTHHLNATG
ncbi:MAG: S8 family peptidase [Calditrichaeota bacterium]|nr:S8 family peptidase [Calditrichota bacterium]